MQIAKSVQGSLFGITRLCILLHTFSSTAFDFNVGVAINESHSYKLTSAILKVDVVCDVTMTGQIVVCKIRFDSTGKNRGKPCLVCKKYLNNALKKVLEFQFLALMEWSAILTAKTLKSLNLFN